MLPGARKFTELGVPAGKRQLEPLEKIETLTREIEDAGDVEDPMPRIASVNVAKTKKKDDSKRAT